MNDFLDHLANIQYQKMHEDVKIEEVENVKLKDLDSTDEIDIDFIIDLCGDK